MANLGLNVYDHDDGDDIAKCIAIDKRGNVYVAGTVTTTNNGLNVLVHSYSSSGSPRDGWPRSYNGTGNGDDYVSSIHVDDDFNVYVAGTSQGSGTGYDLFVWKLATNGSEKWPTSGSPGTGYAYDSLGALRTTATVDEGFFATEVGDIHCDMAVRVSMNPEQRTIALTGSTGTGFAEVKWRTHAFDQNAAGTSVTPRSGWPVDKSVSFRANLPEAVAIHTDNSVYVTGKGHESDNEEAKERFWTVRYNANRSQAWFHDWSIGTSKRASGLDIVLDRDGNAYATGYIGVISDVDYGSVRIPRQWNGSANDLKSDVWHRGDVDRAVSIDLTYELVDDVLKPFIYVTGASEVEATGYDIATIRYSPHTTDTTLNRVWVDVHMSSGAVDDRGRMVIGAGNGNAYVVGLKAGDLVLLGYDKSGSARFTPATYSNGGDDDGWALAPAGPGWLRPTGESEAGTDEQDFITLQSVQLAVYGCPNSATVDTGAHISGALSVLLHPDDSYVVYRSDYNDVGSEKIRVEFTTPSAYTYSSEPSEISLTVEGKCSLEGVKMRVEAYNYVVGEYDELDFRAVETTDTRLVFVIKDDPRRYINPSGSTCRVRLTWDDAEASGEPAEWYAYVDQINWGVLDN